MIFFLVPSILTTVFVAVIVSACGSVEPKATLAPTELPSPDIVIENVWVRPDPLWENAAGYFVVSNNGNADDVLIGVRLSFAMMASLHESIMDGEIHKMVPIDRLDIPAGGQVEFKSMGKHIMIMMLNDGLEYGDMVKIVLIFEKSGEIVVDAELRAE